MRIADARLRTPSLALLAIALLLVPSEAHAARRTRRAKNAPPKDAKASPPARVESEEAAEPASATPMAVVAADDASGIELALYDGNRIVARVKPEPDEGYAALGERVLGRPGSAADLRESNGGGGLKQGQWVTIPWPYLKVEWRRRALAAFFPRDSYGPDGITHVVRFKSDGTRGETLAAIATWYAGRADAVDRLQAASGRRAPLLPGDVVRIPAASLAAEFRTLLPEPSEEARRPAAAKPKMRRPEAPRKAEASPPPPEEPDLSTESVAADDEEDAKGAPPPAASAAEAEQSIASGFELEDDATSQRTFAFVGDGPLEYRKDDRGPYAAYYLREGEALYSAVVGRFTGRVDAEEVSELAERIAERSAIADVTDIPIGARIKIPLDLLLPEYQPPTNPRRIEYEANRRETEKVERPPETADLEGVTVILDAGHGGEDVGAMANDTWESDYVFDVMARVKRILDTETACKVVPTIRDGVRGFKVSDASRLPQDKTAEILTTPPYRPVLGQPGVHFRWYLANYNYRRIVGKGSRAEHVVFTSFHADSLHPSLRGAMVYVPGREYRTQRFSRAGGIYSGRREVKSAPVVTFTPEELIRSEGLSRQLATKLLQAFSRESVPIHPSLPVRDHVIRRGRSWVPAVLKYSEVPAAVLLEVCNLNNPEDARNLRDPDFRERVARAYVDALRAYFGESRKPEVVKAERQRGGDAADEHVGRKKGKHR